MLLTPRHSDGTTRRKKGRPVFCFSSVEAMTVPLESSTAAFQPGESTSGLTARRNASAFFVRVRRTGWPLASRTGM